MLSCPSILGSPVNRLFFLVLACYGCATLYSQQTGQTESVDRETLQLLLKRIDQLETRVKQLETDKQQAADIALARGTPTSPGPSSDAELMAGTNNMPMTNPSQTAGVADGGSRAAALQ